MPRRFNYTGRKKINREDALVRIERREGGITFDVDLRLTDYKLDKVTPAPRVYVEAYRGASTVWKRFDFGRIGMIQPPEDRSLNEFGVPEGILFRVKISAGEGEIAGRLLAEADKIRPRLPDEQEQYGEPLIQHMAADDIGDEVWRVDFTGEMPLLKINSRVPMGVDQFLIDTQHRAVFAPAVMRQVLTRILVIERDTGDEDDDSDWRQRWTRFASQLVTSEYPGTVEDDNGNLTTIEEWIDGAVEAFVNRTGLFTIFSRPVTWGGNS
jgi:hypothetical protein